MNRRQFLAATAGGTACLRFPKLRAAEAAPAEDYRRANTDWLAERRYGIGVHWTAQTVPRSGQRLPFQKAVDAFDVKRFIDALVYAGADYLLLTVTHAKQMLPAPHPVIDKILPGRTCRRDLIAELADGLAARGMPLLIYYNHSCNGRDDPPWKKAVGYYGEDKTPFAQNLIDIIAWMGERYKDRIRAWWFDSPYSLDPRGPVNTVTTSGLLGGRAGQPQDPGQEPLSRQRPAVVRLDLPGRPRLGASPAQQRDSQAALLRRRRDRLRPRLQFAPGPDDVQCRHLSGRHDGSRFGGAVAPAGHCPWRAVAWHPCRQGNLPGNRNFPGLEIVQLGDMDGSDELPLRD